MSGSNPIAASTPLNVGSVVLRGVTVALDTEVGQAFVADCARHTEGLLPDGDIKDKWALTDEHWEALARNAPLLLAIRAERERRISSGDAAREAAQKHFAKAPTVLGHILNDEQVSPRHRIEAARELRQVVGDEPNNALNEKEKFIININLGDDKKIYLETEIPSQKSVLTDDWELS